MASNRKIMVLPGDGIGTEIMQANMRVMDWLAKHKSLNFDMQEGLVGGAAYDAHGTPLTDESMLPLLQQAEKKLMRVAAAFLEEEQLAEAGRRLGRAIAAGRSGSSSGD